MRSTFPVAAFAHVMAFLYAASDLIAIGEDPGSGLVLSIFLAHRRGDERIVAIQQLPAAGRQMPHIGQKDAPHSERLRNPRFYLSGDIDANWVFNLDRGTRFPRRSSTRIQRHFPRYGRHISRSDSGRPPRTYFQPAARTRMLVAFRQATLASLRWGLSPAGSDVESHQGWVKTRWNCLAKNSPSLSRGVTRGIRKRVSCPRGLNSTVHAR
jgi:hypothetical protein